MAGQKVCIYSRYRTSVSAWLTILFALVTAGCGRVDNQRAVPIPVATFPQPQTVAQETLPATSDAVDQPRPVAAPVASPPQSPHDQLRVAERNLWHAETKLREMRDQSLATFHETLEYRNAKQVAEDFEEKVKAMRADKSPRLAETSKQWMAAKSGMVKLVRQYEETLLNEADYAAATTEVTRLKELIAHLQKVAREADARIAEQRRREEEKRREQLEEQVVQSSRSATNSSSGGSVQVKGYYRKDGTYVRPHTRRK